MSTFVLAALKEQQLLKQWVIEAAGSPEALAIQYWPQAKAMGASRLCAASSGNVWFACYDGKKLTPQKLSLPVPVPTPPAPKCPPGQVFNAQGKCVPIGQSQSVPVWPCPTGAQIKAFAASKSLTWSVTSVPPTAPPTATAWAVYARVYSNSNRSFYGWNASAHSWVKDVALTNELLAVCGPKKLTASGPSTTKCQPGYHYDAHAGRCIPNFSLLAGVKTKQFVGEVKWLGEPPSNVLAHKIILLAWSKSIEAQKMVPKLPFDNYGDPSLDDQNTWKCSRDGRMLTAFSVWWNNAKKTPQLSVGVIPTTGLCAGVQTTELDQPHMDALQAWSTGSWPTTAPTIPIIIPTQKVGAPDPACVTDCQSKFGNVSSGNYDAAKLKACLTTCVPGQAPQIPQQNAPQAQPQTKPPGGGPPPATPPTAPAKKSSSTGLLVLGAIGVAVVGAVAVMARKKSEEAA